MSSFRWNKGRSATYPTNLLSACEGCHEEGATIYFEYKHSLVIRLYQTFFMSTLQTELERLFLPGDPDLQNPKAGEPLLITPDGRVRAMVLELSRPADWTMLSTLWQGVRLTLVFRHLL